MCNVFLHLSFPILTTIFTRTNTAQKINTKFSMYNVLMPKCHTNVREYL